ncbi:extracellular serine-rich protein [Gigaspora margarita]|uniref:Extracellular serine-rich protein n=1 Tax=Gigaspora margarita TaxID=4874 RepID=A0A8H4AA28_GIGMA|nr:extracellular serine-rich protein [Gigaspora margarita]
MARLNFKILALLLVVTFVNVIHAADIVVMVGSGTQNVFVPQNFTANPGDNVILMWGGGRHSVLLSGPPAGNCVQMPGSTAVSAAQDTATAKNVTFPITASTPATVWWFCGVPGHCQGGMWGVLKVNGGAAVNSTTGGATPSGAAAPPASPAASSGSNPKGGNGGSGTTGGNGGSGTTGGAAASPSDAKASNANKGGFSGALIIVSGLLMYFSGYLL